MNVTKQTTFQPLLNILINIDKPIIMYCCVIKQEIFPDSQQSKVLCVSRHKRGHDDDVLSDDETFRLH